MFFGVLLLFVVGLLFCSIVVFGMFYCTCLCLLCLLCCFFVASLWYLFCIVVCIVVCYTMLGLFVYVFVVAVSRVCCVLLLVLLWSFVFRIFEYVRSVLLCSIVVCCLFVVFKLCVFFGVPLYVGPNFDLRHLILGHFRDGTKMQFRACLKVSRNRVRHAF